jgi:hypothetical protein
MIVTSKLLCIDSSNCRDIRLGVLYNGREHRYSKDHYVIYTEDDNATYDKYRFVRVMVINENN